MPITIEHFANAGSYMPSLASAGAAMQYADLASPLLQQFANQSYQTEAQRKQLEFQRQQLAQQLGLERERMAQQKTIEQQRLGLDWHRMLQGSYPSAGGGGGWNQIFPWDRTAYSGPTYFISRNQA